MIRARLIGCRLFSKTNGAFDWSNGTEAVATRLFEVYTASVSEGPRVDPRGMRPFELKKLLSGLPDFTGDLSKVKDLHPEIVERWQKLYSSFMNGNVKLPGRDPAGPLTFHHDADKVNVRVMYDKHGRVEH
jgi:hypothetical protein